VAAAARGEAGLSTTALLASRALRLQAGRRTLVQGLDLVVHSGQLWCVLGPNGSGKSTLLHTLAGLHEPDDGVITLASRPLHAWPSAELAQWRGLLPQTTHDAFGTRALDLVLTGRHPYLSRWGWEGADDVAIGREALTAVDALDLAERDVTTLSGGERQRVGIAALLAQQPRLLLLDEPLAHLDLHHQVAVLGHLRHRVCSDSRAVVLSLHDLQLAHRFATHVLLLHGDGRTEHGAADAVLNEDTLSAVFRHPVLRAEAQGQTAFVVG